MLCLKRYVPSENAPPRTSSRKFYHFCYIRHRNAILIENAIVCLLTHFNRQTKLTTNVQNITFFARLAERHESREYPRGVQNDTISPRPPRAPLYRTCQVLYIMRYVYKGGVTVKVLVTDEIAEEGLQVLRRLENIDIVVRTGLSESELLQEIADADAFLVRSQTQVTDRVIAAGAKLRAIGRAGCRR